jgi:hypothetical protein
VGHVDTSLASGFVARQPEERLPVASDAPGGPPFGRPRSRGRSPALTPHLKDQIIGLVREVGALATAARCAGVPVSVAREWLARGLGHDSKRPRTALYAAFADGVEKARGEFVARRIRRIEQAAEGGTWTADAWAVERVDPDSWGRHDRLDVHASVALTEVRALLVWVASLVETYVPSERRATELDNLRAVTADIAGGAVQPGLARES